MACRSAGEEGAVRRARAGGDEEVEQDRNLLWLNGRKSGVHCVEFIYDDFNKRRS